MAQSTYNTLLKVKNSAGEFVKLVDIKNFPDLGGDPELLESTTLSNKNANAHKRYSRNICSCVYGKLFDIRLREGFQV